MFTGIVEALGTVVSVQRYGDAARLRLLAPNLSEGMHLGDLPAVNGVCLTVATIAGDTLEADVAQTLPLSGIGSLAPGDRVNLERAMPPSGVSADITCRGTSTQRARSSIAEHQSTGMLSAPSTSASAGESSALPISSKHQVPLAG